MVDFGFGHHSGIDFKTILEQISNDDFMFVY